MKKNFLNLGKSLEGSLLGKVFAVTGAGSGLGKAIALGLPFAGAKVALIDLNEKAVREVADRINAEFPGFAAPFAASVTDEARLEEAYAEIAAKLGPVFCLVNCAGLARLGPINELVPRDIKLSNGVNMDGYFLNALFASRQMAAQKKGCIINISSASARAASENTSLYGVAKEAQCMMARSWAADLGKHNIRVNALLCGDLYGDPELGIDSGIWNQAYFEKKAIDKGLAKADDRRLGGPSLNPEIRDMVIGHYAKRTALGKQITYTDVLSALVFLCSDSSSKITGESIAVTAGNPGSFSR